MEIRHLLALGSAAQLGPPHARLALRFRPALEGDRWHRTHPYLPMYHAHSDSFVDSGRPVRWRCKHRASKCQNLKAKAQGPQGLHPRQGSPPPGTEEGSSQRPSQRKVRGATTIVRLTFSSILTVRAQPDSSDSSLCKQRRSRSMMQARSESKTSIQALPGRGQFPCHLATDKLRAPGPEAAAGRSDLLPSPEVRLSSDADGFPFANSSV